MQSSITKLQERNRNTPAGGSKSDRKRSGKKKPVVPQQIFINPYSAYDYDEQHPEEPEEDYDGNPQQRISVSIPMVDPEKEEIYKENILLREQLTRQDRDFQRLQDDLDRKMKEVEIDEQNLLNSKIRELEEENSRLKGQVESIVRETIV